MRRENKLVYIMDEEREQAVIYNGWEERTSNYNGVEREQAII